MASSGQVLATTVRFKFVDWLHGIDSIGVQAFRDDLDTNFSPTMTGWVVELNRTTVILAEHGGIHNSGTRLTAAN